MPTNTALLHNNGAPPAPAYKRAAVGGPPVSTVPRVCYVGPYQEPNRPQQQLQRLSANAAAGGGSYIVTPRISNDSGSDMYVGDVSERASDARGRMVEQPHLPRYANRHQPYDGEPQRYGPSQQPEVSGPPPSQHRPEQQYVREYPRIPPHEAPRGPTFRGESGPPPYFPYIQDGEVYYRNTPSSPRYEGDQAVPPYLMSNRQGNKGRHELTKPYQHPHYTPEDGVYYYEGDEANYRRIGPKSSPPPRYRPYPLSPSHHQPRPYRTLPPSPIPQFQPPPGGRFQASPQRMMRVSYPSTGAASLPPQSFRATPGNDKFVATPTRKKTDLATTSGNEASTGPPSIVSSSNNNADSSPSSVSSASQGHSPPRKRSLKLMPSTSKIALTQTKKQPISEKKKIIQEVKEQPHAEKKEKQKVEMYDDALLLAQVAALARGEVVTKEESHVDDDKTSDNENNSVREEVLLVSQKEDVVIDACAQKHPHLDFSPNEKEHEDDEEQRPDSTLQVQAAGVSRGRLLTSIVSATTAGAKRGTNEDEVQRAHPGPHPLSLDEQSQSPSHPEVGQNRQTSRTSKRSSSSEHGEDAPSKSDTSTTAHGRDDANNAVSTSSRNGMLSQPTVTDTTVNPTTRIKPEHDERVEPRDNGQLPPPSSNPLFPVHRFSSGRYGVPRPHAPYEMYGIYEDEPTAAERWERTGGPRIVAEQHPHHYHAQAEGHRPAGREYYVSPSPPLEYSHERGNRHSLLHPTSMPRPAPHAYYVSHPLPEQEQYQNEERCMPPLPSSPTVAMGAKPRVQFTKDKRNTLPNHDSHDKRYITGEEEEKMRMPPPPHSSGGLYCPPPPQFLPRQFPPHHFSGRMSHRHGLSHHLRHEGHYYEGPYAPPREHQQRAGVVYRQFETPLTPGSGGVSTEAVSTPTSTSGMRSRSGSVDGYEDSPPPHQNYYQRNYYGGFGAGGPPLPPPHMRNSSSMPVKRTILRRKCAWKNYPELESFLIANREDYLRHSAMNYTIQQKQYNNRLTERLLEVAAKHNYVFDEKDFNFVAVRDRIRCYYKSYVQSSKKRGETVGFSGTNVSKKRKLSSLSKLTTDETRGDESEDYDDEEDDDDYADDEVDDTMGEEDQVNSCAGAGRDDVHRDGSSGLLDSTSPNPESHMTKMPSVVV